MWDAVAYLLAGQIGFGGAGFVIDKVFTTGWVTLVGMLTGMAVSLYVVWFRYGIESMTMRTDGAHWRAAWTPIGVTRPGSCASRNEQPIEEIP